ncbi:MAG: DUF2760 domain-containing protein [Planctomycetia bacterium]|nr:DUF2760 domain-containing protein [Planctomycetia bacterium]
MSLGIAFRAFFAALTDSTKSKCLAQALNVGNSETDQSVESVNATLERCEARRSEAIELLAALQRDARFVDFIKEDVSGASDADLGAVARAVHDNCATTLERIFQLRPVSEVAEGQALFLSAKEASNSARVRVSGAFQTSDSDVSTRVVHSGWQATRSSLPHWQGRAEDSAIVAPIEVEIMRD